MHEVGRIDELPAVEGKALWISIRSLISLGPVISMLKPACYYLPNTVHLLRPMKAPSVAPGSKAPGSKAPGSKAPGKTSSDKSKPRRKAAKKAAPKKASQVPQG